MARTNFRLTILLIASIILFTTGFFSFRQYEDWLMSKVRENLTQTLEVYRDSIETIISRRVDLLNGLENYVVSESDQNIIKNFPVFSQGLFNGIEGVRYIGMAPKGVMTLIYPLKGNETLLNYNIFSDKDPNTVLDLSRMLSTSRLILTNPILGGNTGSYIVVRKPIYKNNIFWGYVSESINIPSIVSYSGLEKGSKSLKIALKDKNGNGFWGENTLFQNNPVLVTVHLTDGFWEIGAEPLHGWGSETNSMLIIFSIIIGLFGILILIILNLILKNDIRLALTEKTITDSDWGIRIVLIYTVVSTAWILFSDRALSYFIQNPLLLSQLQTIKGWVFVIISASLLYWIIQSAFEKYQITTRAQRSILSCYDILIRAKNEHQLIQEICEEFVKNGYKIAWLFLTDKEFKRTIKVSGIAGTLEGTGDDEGWNGPVGTAIKTGKVILINNVSSSLKNLNKLSSKTKYKSVMAVPLIDNGQTLGTLAIYSKNTNAFSFGDIRIISKFSEDLIAIVNRLRDSQN